MVTKVQAEKEAKALTEIMLKYGMVTKTSLTRYEFTPEFIEAMNNGKTIEEFIRCKDVRV